MSDVRQVRSVFCDAMLTVDSQALHIACPYVVRVCSYDVSGLTDCFSGLAGEGDDAGAPKEERAAKFVEYMGSRIKARLAPILQRLPGKNKSYVWCRTV